MTPATPFCVALAGFALGAGAMALANRRIAPELARGRWLKFASYVVIVHAVLGMALLGAPFVRALFVALFACCAVELARAWMRIATPRPRIVAPVAVLVGAAATYATLRHAGGVLVWCFLTVACTDGFAQVTGQWLGRRALAPRLSPGKTVEGVVGGFAAAVIVSVVLGPLAGLSPWRAASCGALVAVAALAGDLGASWVKRRAGIKDYSSALPGHGGFLDRFDSLIGALALLAMPGMPA